jgi:hypothetical protein
VRGTAPGPPLDGEIRRVLRMQDGTIARAQLLQLRETEPGLQRRLRRRELVRVVPGVYVDHTGRLTWQQRAWVAVLHAWPAALFARSAWLCEPTIHVAHARGRAVAPVPGVVFHAAAHLDDDHVWWLQNPPRFRIEHAALDEASRASDDFAAVAALCDVVQRRLTTYAALLDALDTRSRLRRGRWLRRVLVDLTAGANSVLEHAYLVRVERAHGLPVGRRQLVARPDGRRVERDVVYEPFDRIVELDGVLVHNTTLTRDADLDRDLTAAAVEGRETTRLGWGQVVGRPCWTAEMVALLLNRHGWTGAFRRCPSCPPGSGTGRRSGR